MTSVLDFHWDDNEHAFAERFERESLDNAPAQRNVEDYFKFLSEVGADRMGKPEGGLADKQFAL
jgi:hypothetical protein